MNELIEIKDKELLAIFSEDNGLDAVINQTRELVNNFEHDLSTDAGRKRTASLAAKVARLKTKIDGLGKSLTDDWAKKKKAVDVNRKAMRDALDELKKEARKPLDEWEAEQAKIELQKQIDDAYEIAVLMNEKFDAERKIKQEEEQKAETERIAKEAAEREAWERKIAQEAAEKERKAAIEREEQIKRQAAEAERARIAAEERAKIQAEEAEKRMIEAEHQAKIQAEKAAEDARLAEIERQRAEQQRISDELAAREANKKHISSIRTDAKESLMKLGIDEDTCKKIVLAIHNKEIANISINY